MVNITSQKTHGGLMTQPEVEKNRIGTTGRVQKEWRRPVLRKLPIAATAHKTTGNEGSGQGKGDNFGTTS
jgi:hypothetical protein